MKRRVFLRRMGQASLLPAALHAAGQKKRPNILFFFADDHSIQTLGAYKTRLRKFIKKHKITPNIDSIASGGALFENSFVCNSICGPSRAAVLTGKHSHINGFKANGDKFNPKQWNMAKAFRKVGYNTAIFGKWHLGTLPAGFDAYKVLQGQGTYYNPELIVNNKEKTVRRHGYCTDIVSEMTIEWLKKRKNKDKPFFLCSWHKSPHRVWMPHPRHFKLLDNVRIPEPENLFDDYKGRTSSAREQEMSIAKEINIVGDVKVSPPLASSTPEQIKESIPQTASCYRTLVRESMGCLLCAA
ncbi:N-acetylglucosamine-6-O-sulfatase [subsurface metagenome]